MAVDLDEPTLAHLIDAATTGFSSKRALVYDQKTLTYGQLGRYVENLAKGLIGLGLKYGDKVGIFMVDNVAWIPSFFAAAKAGAVIVPINARYRAHDLKYILDHAEINTLIIGDLNPEIQDYVSMVRGIHPRLTGLKGPQSKSHDPVYPKNVVIVGPREHAGMIGVDKLTRMGADEVPDEDLRHRQDLVRPEDIALIQYTSGTTSFPKGCLITHEIVVRNALCCALRQEIEEGRDIFFDVMPPFHVVGMCFGIIPCIAYGCCRVGRDHFDPLEALQWIEKEKCTVHGAMGDMLKAELDHPNFADYDLSSLRTGFSSDAPTVFRKIEDVLPNWKIISIFGLSEVGGNLATTRRSDPVEVRMHNHGRPHDGLDLKIVDPATNSETPNGEDGEICTRGWTVMKGYYKDPEATSRTIDNEGWLHTGDRGLVDDDGLLRWLGRIKDTMKVGGENVAPKEVENYLSRYPKIREVQVVGVKDPKYTEVVAAFIELKKGVTCTESEIFDFCRGQIAGFKVPKHIRFVEEWPMSATKVQKFKLKEQLESELANREQACRIK